MSTLNPRFALSSVSTVAAIFVVLWQAASPSSAATIGLSGAHGGDASAAQQTWLFESPRKSATDMSVLAKDGNTYHVTLESDKLGTVRFTNRLFLSETLDSSDIDREMQIASRAQSNQKLLFTNVEVASPPLARSTGNAAFLPTDIDLYLKALSSELRDVLNIGAAKDGSNNDSAYVDIKNAISLDGSAQQIDKEMLKETIIVSREYGGVSKGAVELESLDATGLDRFVSMMFSQTTLFIAVFAMMLISMFSRIFARSRSVRT